MFLTYRIPDFIGLLVSFMVSALYWVGHLKLFKFVSEVNSRLLWLNIYFLLAIVLLPFSTAMFVNGFDRQGPFTFYCFNLALIAILNLVLFRYVYRSENGMTGFDAIQYGWLRARGWNVLLIWVIAGLLGGWYISRFCFILLFVNQFFIDRYYKKKLKGI